MQDITIAIKTFNRRKALIRLLKSIVYYYPDVQIIVVDDSRKNNEQYINKRIDSKNIKYIHTEYDIGLSSGRNILLNNITTKYFVLCDDDFIFDKRTNLILAKQMLETNHLDLLGGMVYNRMCYNSVYSVLWSLKHPSRVVKILKKEEFKSVYNGYYLISEDNVRLVVEKKKDFTKEKLYRTEICSNFFIANTDKVKEIGGWKPESLKVGEHEIFFLKAKQENVQVGFTTEYGVVHYPKKTLLYMKNRARQQVLFRAAWKKMGYRSFEIEEQ